MWLKWITTGEGDLWLLMNKIELFLHFSEGPGKPQKIPGEWLKEMLFSNKKRAAELALAISVLILYVLGLI